MAAISCLCALVALLEQKREDLWKLMICPESVQKLFGIFFKV